LLIQQPDSPAQFVKPEDIDFVTGSDEAPLEIEEPPKNALERFWRWLA
jgi:hypothetical protein